MATFRILYVNGYGHAGADDRETVDAKGFRLSANEQWVDFFDAAGDSTLSVRAEDVVRVERVGRGARPAPASDDYDIEDEELAG